MALLTAGYFHTTYFAQDYFADDYWQDYGSDAFVQHLMLLGVG